MLKLKYFTKAAGTKKASKSQSSLFSLEQITSFDMVLPDESKVDM